MLKKKKIRRKRILAKLREVKLRNKLQEDSELDDVEYVELEKKPMLAKPLKKEEILPVKDEMMHRKSDDSLKIREEPPKIADSLFLQLEEEVIGFINRRLEEHTVKRIKGILLPIAKFSLKLKKHRNKFMKDQAKYFLDLEDDLDYIIENSKLKRISPKAGEKFSPALHEEVDFTWNPNHGELEILASLRDGFFWEYNQEMILKPQVVVNRRV